MARTWTSEDLTCKCGKVCKSLAGLQGHKRFCKEIDSVTTRPPVAESAGESTPTVAPPTKIMFRSPHAASLRIVVRPTYQVGRTTPAGIVMVREEGKTAEFRNGLLITDDPEIIEYLEKKYNDPRFPVFSDRKLQEMGKGLVG